MIRKLKFVALLVAASLLAMSPAYADLNAVGPVNPQNGYPAWYQDSNGLALEIGLDPVFNILGLSG